MYFKNDKKKPLLSISLPIRLSSSEQLVVSLSMSKLGPTILSTILPTILSTTTLFPTILFSSNLFSSSLSSSILPHTFLSLMLSWPNSLSSPIPPSPFLFVKLNRGPSCLVLWWTPVTPLLNIFLSCEFKTPFARIVTCLQLQRQFSILNIGSNN